MGVESFRALKQDDNRRTHRGPDPVQATSETLCIIQNVCIVCQVALTDGSNIFTIHTHTHK